MFKYNFTVEWDSMCDWFSGLLKLSALVTLGDFFLFSFPLFFPNQVVLARELSTSREYASKY